MPAKSLEPDGPDQQSLQSLYLRFLASQRQNISKLSKNTTATNCSDTYALAQWTLVRPLKHQVVVLQGERPLAKDNKKLGMFRLDGIPTAPKGSMSPQDMRRPSEISKTADARCPQDRSFIRH